MNKVLYWKQATVDKTELCATLIYLGKKKGKNTYRFVVERLAIRKWNKAGNKVYESTWPEEIYNKVFTSLVVPDYSFCERMMNKDVKAWMKGLKLSENRVGNNTGH